MEEEKRLDLIAQAKKTVSEIEAVSDQVEKLGALMGSGKISDEAYSELEGEYKERAKAISLVSQDILRKLEKELEEIKPMTSDLEKEKEVIEAKRLIGAFTEERYEEEMAKLSEKLGLLEERSKLQSLAKQLGEGASLHERLFPPKELVSPRKKPPAKSPVKPPTRPANVCPSCGTVNRSGAKFCRKCGASLIPKGSRRL